MDGFSSSAVGLAPQLWGAQATARNRVTKERAAERWPAVSADGARLAYVSIADGTHKLRSCDRLGRDSVALTDPRQTPIGRGFGDRLAWTATARGWVFVSPLERYINLVGARHSNRHGVPTADTRAPDISPADAIPPVGYNGDPDRTGDRDANVLNTAAGRLWTVDAPSSPDQQLAEQTGTPAASDRAQRNADAFDQTWNRTAALYYSAPDAAARRTQWEALKTKYRRAIAQTDDEQAVVRLLREHPPHRQRLRRPRIERASGRDSRGRDSGEGRERR
jgi:hypothetical protein